jgi:hypothetical protein
MPMSFLEPISTGRIAGAWSGRIRESIGGTIAGVGEVAEPGEHAAAHGDRLMLGDGSGAYKLGDSSGDFLVAE